MDESGRPRARSDAQPPESSARNRAANDADCISPMRTSVENGSGTRRYSSVTSRRSNGSGVPSLVPRSTLAQRTQGKFTLAGPEGTP
ncbi:unnamed protein product [Penicillium glandicola]